MKIHRPTRRIMSHILIACAVIPLLLAACQPAAVPTSLPTLQPAVTEQAPVQTSAPVVGLVGEISLDLSGVATNQTVETVAAVPPDSGGPYWDVAPQYRRVTLQGYPVTNHLMKPQILVYPVAELAGFNEAAGKNAADLQALLQSRQAVDWLPFLPLFNAMQVMHAQLQYLDFKNGSGIRFLTQFDQAPLPINNFELIYTFQGLTSDGRFYIAAVLPVTHPGLPDTQQVSQQQIAELSDFPAYLAKTVTWLDGQPAGSFTPDLAALDALIRSIEVK